MYCIKRRTGDSDAQYALQYMCINLPKQWSRFVGSHCNSERTWQRRFGKKWRILNRLPSATSPKVAKEAKHDEGVNNPIIIQLGSVDGLWSCWECSWLNTNWFHLENTLCGHHALIEKTHLYIWPNAPAYQVGTTVNVVTTLAAAEDANLIGYNSLKQVPFCISWLVLVLSHKESWNDPAVHFNM